MAYLDLDGLGYLKGKLDTTYETIEDANDLKSQIHELTDVDFTAISFTGNDFEYGSISSSTGIPDSNKHAIHTDFIFVDSGEKVVFTNTDSNIARMIAVYDASKTFVEVIGNRNSTATVTTPIDTVGYVRLILGTKDYSQISTSDFDTLAQKITIASTRANVILPTFYAAQKSTLVTDKLSDGNLKKKFSSDSFTYGSVSGGVPDSNKHAIHTDLIYIDSGEKVVYTNTDTNVGLMISVYDEDKTFVKLIGSRSSTQSATTTIETVGFVRLVIGTKDYSQIPTSSFDSYAQKVVITSNRENAIYPTFYELQDAEDKLSAIYPKVQTYQSTYDYDTKTEAFDALYNESGDVDAFIFFTDPHLLSEGEKSAFYNRFIDYTGVIGGFFNRLATTFVLCAGDWLEFNDTPNLALYKLNLMTGRMRELFGDHYYPALGNHDTNEQGTEVSGVKRLSFDTLRNVMFPYQGSMYYSFKTAQSRFYVLNTGTDQNTGMSVDDRWDQIAWLAEQLAENDDAHSAVCMHILWNDTLAASITDFADNVQELVGAYNSHDTIELNSVTYDFTGCTGKVGFIIGGHLHQDKSDTTSYSVPIIATANVRNNANYPTFDLVLVDWTANTMQMIRVGSGSNQSFTLA